MFVLLGSRSAKFLIPPFWTSSFILTVGGNVGGTSSEYPQLYTHCKRDMIETVYFMEEAKNSETELLYFPPDLEVIG